MAESSNSRVVDITDIAADDPFAELTRIMGHDPRAEASKGEGKTPENDLEIDLENELLGGLAEIETVSDEGMTAEAETPPQEAPEFGDDFDDAIESALSGEFGEDTPDPEDEDASVAPEEADIPGLAPVSRDADPQPEPPEISSDDGDLASADTENGQGGADDDLEGTLESLLADPAKDMEHFSAPQPEDFTSDTSEEADLPFDYASAAVERHDYLGEPEETPREPAEPEAPRQQAEPYEEWDVSDDDPFGIIAGMKTATQAPPEAPAVETVDVGDKPVAVADDLDIPDVSYREEKPVASEFDELETELDGAFGDVGTETARSESPSAREEAPDSGFEDLFGGFDEGASDDAPRQPDGEAAAAPVPDRWQDPAPAHGAAAGMPFDPAELEDFPPPSGRAAGGESGGRRRALVVAAIVAGVAVAGGAGAFALWSGDDNAAPAVVQADDDPVKVKPENPGGAQVPNQDNEVYQRFSDVAAKPEAVQQEELVTTAEEPMDVSAGPAPRAVEFETSAEEPAAAASADEPPAAAMPEPVKSEARLSPATEEGSEVADEVVAVAPRKVRTMVVRPDGTMVPREMPAPSVEPATTNNAAATSDTLPGVEVPEEPTTAAAAESADNTGTPGAGATSAQDAIVPTAASDPAVTTEAREPVASGQEPDADAASTASAAVSTTAAAEGTPGAETATEEVAAAGVAVPATAPIPTSRPARPRATAAASTPTDTAPQATPTDTAQQQVARAEPAQQAAAPVTEAVPTEWSVQISSQPSIPAAQQSYRDLAQRHSDILSGQGVNIVRAEIEGRGTYYRVRIPSQSKDDAIKLCERLQAAGGNCFVSR